MRQAGAGGQSEGKGGLEESGQSRAAPLLSFPPHARITSIKPFALNSPNQRGATETASHTT